MATPRTRSDGGGGDSRPTTNVFALRELAALEWRVYGADTSGSTSTSRSSSPSVSSSEVSALFARLQQQQLLTVLDEAPEGARVWLFVVNNGGHDFPAADTLGDLIEVDSGAWTRGGERPLGAQLQQRLFRSLHALLSRRLLRHADFARDGAVFCPNDARFVYRSPSRSELNHFDAYLDEALPRPAFELHFQLFLPSHLVAVTVAMVVEDATLPRAAGAGAGELGDPRASWQRLLGLPRATNHSMVDVWHLDDGLVPRVVAETKYSDVYPRFRAVAKRRHKRKSDDGDANDGDDGKKTDENDDDGDDEDDDAAHDADGGDGDAGDLLRRAAPGKKKRKKANADAAENDESVAPVSPDTHVNTPEATCPTIRVTFPRDSEPTLHYDAQVSRFKRRRDPLTRPKTTTRGADMALVFAGAGANRLAPTGSNALATSRRSSAAEFANSHVRSTEALALPSHLQERRSSFFGTAPPSSSMAPRADTKPTLSVAVSLVASLSHDEQQEALDGRPTKTHPLLEALRSFVEQELSENVAEKARRVTSCKRDVLPNALAYVPSAARKAAPALLAANAATAERLRNNLLADRFKPWASDYSPHQFLKRTKQCRKERQRKLLLEFDGSKLAEFTRQRQLALTGAADVFQSRDEEIALGVQVAASDALVGWRQSAGDANRWAPSRRRSGTRSATPREKRDLAERVQPYLLALRSMLAKVGEDANATWLNFSDYAARQGAGGAAHRHLEPPKLNVATADVGFVVDPPTISEYSLRGFHPVAAAKPVDYAIVCPHSPSEWLGTLALSYVTCFRSMYAQCHMGDHAPVDLAHVEPTSSVSVDASNALLLVACASSAYDAFATYRSAGELLRPVLSNGVKKTQAFSRSAVAHVVYVVVPFRREDVKHKMWALGAFSRGLFGATPADALWRPSVTLELLYLEDLYEVGVNPSPFALLPSCFAVYDRVFENVSLKPVGNDPAAAAAAASQGGRSRFICERLYHLADVKRDDDAPTPCVYGGYAVSEDRKWLACSCVDALGSILETHMLRLDGVAFEDALERMMGKWLDFLALFGERARLVVCRLGAETPDDAAEEDEVSAWQTLSATRATAFVPAAFAPLVADVTLLVARFVETPAVELREDDASLACDLSDVGYLVVSPMERGADGSRGACLATGGGYSAGSTCSPLSPTRGDREAVVLKVSVLADDLLPTPAGTAGAAAPGGLGRILRDFYALSYLTMHPMTASRASPLPLHLAAVDKLCQDTRALALQLRTDPLELR
ncbi:hypothetical protein PybrP1_008265 [[Pythium] brassicae (nom. inval.)]|nr:hypothetical protein PybrP1_008265 [[Pythium] brassicae (nom. inval.)]